MTCDGFVERLDGMVDERKGISESDLPAEMRDHLEGCTNCSAYRETIEIASKILNEIKHEDIPAALRERLLSTYMSRPLPHRPTHLPAGFPLRMILPMVVVFALSLLMPERGRAFVEIAITVYSLAVVFEKIGRRLVTDRV